MMSDAIDILMNMGLVLGGIVLFFGLIVGGIFVSIKTYKWFIEKLEDKDD